MQEYIVTIKTSKNEVIETPFKAKSEKDAKAQMAIFFDANYKAPDRYTYVVTDVTPAN